MSPKDQLLQLRELLKVEKEEDFQQYQNKVLNTSVSDRQKDGVCWFPVKAQSHRIGTGERIVVQVDKIHEDETNHVFQVGSVVSIFRNSAVKEREKYAGGVVSYLRKGVMKVVLNSHEVPDWLYDGKLGVDLMFDEATYREMDKALAKLIGFDKSRTSELLNIFYGTKEAHIRRGHAYQSLTLNNRQNDALSNILNAEDIAVIHGPPGTGKTTTVVQGIREVVKKEKQVLVCAPSNAAVDLLVEKLTDFHLDVLRIGHPARVQGAAVESSLDYRISQHKSFGQLKELRKKAEGLKQMGSKYRKNFGHAERKQRRLILNEARNLKLEADHIESYITHDLFDNAAVVACTLINANHPLVTARRFKTVFIDEASQALEPACWIPIMKAERVVLAGDHFQLPPTIKSSRAAKEGLEVTLFEKAIEHQKVDVMLETQYRMLPEIMEFSSRTFYKGKLMAAKEVSENVLLGQPIFGFIDTAGAGYTESVDQKSLSTYNLKEAHLVVNYLKSLLEEYHEKIDEYKLRIGLIAPYKAQIQLLRDMIEEEELSGLKAQIDINTVDAFQGQERDVIVISLTRSNFNGEIGFLKEVRRLNVAMTRAKSKLVIFGDSATLSNHPFFAELIDYLQNTGGYQSVFETPYQLAENL